MRFFFGSSKTCRTICGQRNISAAPGPVLCDHALTSWWEMAQQTVCEDIAALTEIAQFGSEGWDASVLLGLLMSLSASVKLAERSSIAGRTLLKRDTAAPSPICTPPLLLPCAYMVREAKWPGHSGSESLIER